MLVVMTAMVAVGPLSTDLYLPSLPTIGVDLGADVARAQLTLGIFMAGFAAGTLLNGPLSDRFGRRPVMLCGLVLFALASAACALAETIGQLIVWRALEGFAGAAAPVVSRAVVRDLYQREDAARILSYMTGAMALAPALAPALGGVIHGTFGWRGHFWVLAGTGVLLALVAVRTIGETNRNIDASAVSPLRLAAAVKRLVGHSTFLGYVFTNGFSYGGLFSFISGGSFVLISALGVQPQNFGFLFMMVAASFVVGGMIGGRLSRRVGMARLIAVGVSIGVVGGTAGLMLALSGVESIATVVGPTALVFFAYALVAPNCVAGAVSSFPDMAGTASSVAGFLQMATGATLGVVVGATFDGTAMPMFAVITASTIMAAVIYFSRVRPRETA